MVSPISECKPFLDFNMKKEIMLPNNIYDKFKDLMSSIMVLFAMTNYSLNYNKSMDEHTHFFKLMKDGNRAFTITLYNNVDKYRATFVCTVSYHFHADYPLMKKYEKLFDTEFDGFRDDNFISFQTEEQIINGLEKFLTII